MEVALKNSYKGHLLLNELLTVLDDDAAIGVVHALTGEVVDGVGVDVNVIVDVNTLDACTGGFLDLGGEDLGCVLVDGSEDTGHVVLLRLVDLGGDDAKLVLVEDLDLLVVEVHVVVGNGLLLIAFACGDGLGREGDTLDDAQVGNVLEFDELVEGCLYGCYLAGACGDAFNGGHILNVFRFGKSVVGCVVELDVAGEGLAFGEVKTGLEEQDGVVAFADVCALSLADVDHECIVELQVDVVDAFGSLAVEALDGLILISYFACVYGKVLDFPASGVLGCCEILEAELDGLACVCRDVDLARGREVVAVSVLMCGDGYLCPCAGLAFAYPEGSLCLGGLGVGKVAQILVEREFQVGCTRSVDLGADEPALDVAGAVAAVGGHTI